MKYKVSIPPNKEEWLSLDEADRVKLVEDFIKRYEKEISPGAVNMHACAHVLVENQLALETEPTPRVYKRLISEGLDRHNVIHAIGAVVNEHLYESLIAGKEIPYSKCQARLEKLTAKNWLKGKY